MTESLNLIKNEYRKSGVYAKIDVIASKWA
jgi:hypothetical protein